MELEDRYVVLKRSDVDLALTREQKIQLSQMCYDIASWRDAQSKSLNKYVVINQDESYFPAVLKLMEEASHKAFDPFAIDRTVEEEDEEYEDDGSGLHQCPYCYDLVTNEHEEFCRLNPSRNREIVP